MIELAALFPAKEEEDEDVILLQNAKK